MPQIKDCPHCKAEDSLETFLRIDLDDVVLEPAPGGEGAWRIASFTLAGSANDPDTGLVSEEATISCRECGESIDEQPNTGWGRVMAHWTFTPSAMTGGV